MTTPLGGDPADDKRGEQGGAKSDLDGGTPMADGPLAGDGASGDEMQATWAGPVMHTEAPVVYVAGFWRRLAAELIDLACLSPMLLLSLWLVARTTDVALLSFRPEVLLDLVLDGGAALYGVVGLCGGLIMLYEVLFLATTGRTPGMSLLRVRAIDVYGERPQWWRAAVRVLGSLFGAALIGLGLLWIGFDREKRGLHDRLAGTYVIRGRASKDA